MQTHAAQNVCLCHPCPQALIIPLLAEKAILLTMNPHEVPWVMYVEYELIHEERGGVANIPAPMACRE